MALGFRTGGSQSPDRWFNSPRNNHVWRNLCKNSSSMIILERKGFLWAFRPWLIYSKRLFYGRFYSSDSIKSLSPTHWLVAEFQRKCQISAYISTKQFRCSEQCSDRLPWRVSVDNKSLLLWCPVGSTGPQHSCGLDDFFSPRSAASTVVVEICSTAKIVWVFMTRSPLAQSKSLGLNFFDWNSCRDYYLKLNVLL